MSERERRLPTTFNGPAYTAENLTYSRYPEIPGEDLRVEPRRVERERVERRRSPDSDRDEIRIARRAPQPPPEPYYPDRGRDPPEPFPYAERERERERDRDRDRTVRAGDGADGDSSKSKPLLHYTISRDETAASSAAKDKLHALRASGPGDAALSMTSDQPSPLGGGQERVRIVEREREREREPIPRRTRAQDFEESDSDRSERDRRRRTRGDDIDLSDSASPDRRRRAESPVIIDGTRTRARSRSRPRRDDSYDSFIAPAEARRRRIPSPSPPPPPRISRRIEYDDYDDYGRGFQAPTDLTRQLEQERAERRRERAQEKERQQVSQLAVWHDQDGNDNGDGDGQYHDQNHEEDIEAGMDMIAMGLTDSDSDMMSPSSMVRMEPEEQQLSPEQLQLLKQQLQKQQLQKKPEQPDKDAQTNSVMVNSLVPSSPYDGPVVVTPLPSPPPAAPPLAVQAERGRKRNVAGAKNGNGNVTASKEGVRWNLGPISGAAAVELGQASPDLLRASSPQMPRGEYQNSVRRTNGKRTSFVSRPTAGRDPEAEHSGQPGPPGPQSRRLLQDKIQTLQDELKSLKKRSKEHEPSVTYEVFHCIIGSNNSETVYHGEPSWVVTGNDLVLNASSPVLDHRGYIRYKRSLAFVVYKRYSPVKGQAEAKEALMQNKKLPKPEPITESIKIISDEMTDAFDFFVEEQEKTGTWSGEESRSMQAPYRWWYACRHKNVLSYLAPRDKELMDTLTGWIDRNYHSIYERVDAQFKRGVVTSTSMEYLVRPGDILLQMSEKHIQTLFATSWLAKTIVNAFPPEKQDLNSGDSNQKKKHEWSWHAQGVEYTYTGTFNETVTIQEVKLKADSVEEEVKIVDLDVMPLRFAEEAVRAKLERRGKTFWNCREKQLVSYDTSIEDGSYSPAQRFMVDYQTYRQLHPNLSTSSYRRYENRMDKAFSTKSDKVPSEPEIYLCPAEIVGFDLRRKKWDDLQVDFIQDVVWNKEAFNRLEVDQETKELVQALVTNQLAAEKGTDWIQNKGNGLIMLLHGSPGTGKTFTAESVAEMAEKPLYTVTCGDIGTNPSEVEKYLGSVFYLGKIWGCVVLIDEAEVFLEQRSLQDLQRNALVSVFLRALEYYEGILILTSNRVGTFDEAFKSRIQLALHYDKLNKRQRNKIWRNFFNRLKALNEHNIDYAEIDDEIGDLADVEMNGRQIRNSITTARQLAQFKKEKMTSAHLRHAIKVASKFDTYLGEINEGVTDEEIARDGRIR